MDVEAQNFEATAVYATNSLYDLSSQFRKAQKLSNREAGPALAQEMVTLSNQTGISTEAVLKATEWPDDELDSRFRDQKRKLRTELDILLHKIRDFQTSVTEKLKEQQQRQGAAEEHRRALHGDSYTENTPLLNGNQEQQQQQQQQTNVLDRLDATTVNIHSAIVGEREDEILEIQRGAHEINAIFRDLGVLVSEQGHQLDTVEDNITDLARQTENAGRQLLRAEHHQRSRGKWTCIALSVLLVITILVGLNVVT